MSDFASLNTALSGLLAHRRASEQIGQNITNVNTEGYSRTRVDLSSAGGSPVPAVFSTPRLSGDGVNVAGLVRIRDEFLERRSLVENATGSQLERSTQLLNRIESTFPEPSDTGLAAQMSSFWAGFDDVANNPASLGPRSQLLERASTVAQTMNRQATDLEGLRTSAVDEMGTMVTQVNSNLARIADLNGAIQNSVNAGLPANDLQDQRDLLIEKVAKLTGATTRDSGSGMVDVVIGGTTLVNGVNASTLTQPAQTPPPTGDPTLDAVGWAKVSISANGYPVSFQGGEMSGMLDGVNRILPNYLNQLNGVATKLAADVNALHTTGFGLNDAGPAAPGRAFFAFTAGVGAAAGLRLSNSTDTPPGVAGNPAAVAIAAQPGTLDASIAQAAAKLHDSATGADASYQSMIASLGVESRTAQDHQTIQTAITGQVDAQRKAVSGVNLDEEMINLTMTQHAYSASAKLMTTIDQMIQDLINLGK